MLTDQLLRLFAVLAFVIVAGSFFLSAGHRPMKAPEPECGYANNSVLTYDMLLGLLASKGCDGKIFRLDNIYNISAAAAAVGRQWLETGKCPDRKLAELDAVVIEKGLGRKFRVVEAGRAVFLCRVG